MRFPTIFSSILMIFLLALCNETRAGTWATGSATTAAGTRAYKVWIPDGYQTGNALPLLLMLHGCTQNPDDFAAGTQMNSFADQYRFFTVYPDQPDTANGTKCWNWFEPTSQMRNSGESSILAQVVQDVRANYRIRSDKIFAAGMSAGAAMTVIMGAAYPDVFSGIAVSAGLEYRAGNNAATGVAAQVGGGPDPNTQGQLAYAEMGPRARRMPVIVFHGTLDPTVNYTNGQQVIQQWVQTNDLVDDGLDNNSVDAAADRTTTGTVPTANGKTYTRSVYNDAGNRPLLEFWSVDLMRHAYSGGSGTGSYTDPTGPNASFETVRFFGLLAPTAANATLGGRVVLENGRGIGNVTLVLNGGDLTAPRYARTNVFGFYRFADIPAGATYVVTAHHKNYTFRAPAQAFSLVEDFDQANFIADRRFAE